MSSLNIQILTYRLNSFKFYEQFNLIRDSPFDNLPTTAVPGRGYPNFFFFYLHLNICCGYSLEVLRRGTSNKYQQHMFKWRSTVFILNIWTPLTLLVLQLALYRWVHCPLLFPAAPLSFQSCPLPYFNYRHQTLHFGENFIKIGPKLKKLSRLNLYHSLGWFSWYFFFFFFK